MASIKTAPVKNTDEYIMQFPPKQQAALEQIRKAIKAAAPGAEEVISYNMPAYKYNGMLVYFAGYEHHVGFYPTPSGIEAFIKELAVYKNSKGSVQFPLDKPMPLTLVKKMVQFRIKENSVKAKPAPAAVKSKSIKLSDEQQVNEYLAKLDAAVSEEINAVRKIIKAANSKLNERIKWNAPSYYYKEDILTFGPYKTHKLLLVFHHPAVVKIKSALLEGDYKDRRLVHLKDKADAAKNKKELSRIINEIVKTIDNSN